MNIKYIGVKELRFILSTRAENIFCSVMLFIIFVALVTYIYVDKQHIICEYRPPNAAINCVLIDQYFGVFHSITQLGQLFSAQVEGEPGRKHTFYYVNLVTSRGKIRLSYWKTGFSLRPIKKAEAINNYLTDHENPNFTIPYIYSSVDLMIFMWLFVILYQSIKVLFDPILLLTISKTKENLRLTQGNSLKLIEKTFALADIKEIIIQEKEINKLLVFLNSNSNNQKIGPPVNHLIKKFNLVERNRKRGVRFKFRFALVFRDDRSLILTRYFKANYNEMNKSANQINSFIKK
jgi:hypothetical protein